MIRESIYKFDDIKFNWEDRTTYTTSLKNE